MDQRVNIEESEKCDKYLDLDRTKNYETWNQRNQL